MTKFDWCSVQENSPYIVCNFFLQTFMQLTKFMPLYRIKRNCLQSDSDTNTIISILLPTLQEASKTMTSCICLLEARLRWEGKAALERWYHKLPLIITGAHFSKAPETFQACKAMTNLETYNYRAVLATYSQYEPVEVPFIQKVSGIYTSPFLNMDELKAALLAWKVFGAFRETGPWAEGSVY